MTGRQPLSNENICKIFHSCADFCTRKLQCGTFTLYAYFIDGLTSGGDIAHYIFAPISKDLSGRTMAELYENALDGMVVNAVARICDNPEHAANFLVNGFCVVLFPNVGAIAFEAKTGEKRGMSGPELEHTAKGSKDAFVETVRTNTSLVRRHLRTPDLRMTEQIVGRRSLTNVTVLWVQGITNPELVRRMEKRLSSIDIDGLLTPSAVEEYITGSRVTPFPLLQYTERTDRFCQGLLQGRVGLLVDGIPLGYLAPVDIGYLMDSPEDLTRDFLSASWVRLLRYGALLLGLLLPAVYIAAAMGNIPGMPAAIAEIIARNRVGFSPVWEVLGMLLAFELLQESGVHLPQNIGQSVSIIGGIVVGTAGVEAGLISSMALIVVSTAGVCGFVLPNRDLAAAVRLCRFLLSILAGILGMWGILLGLVILAAHLASLRSMGVAYLRIFRSAFLRTRLKKNIRRDPALKPVDRRNQR